MHNLKLALGTEIRYFLERLSGTTRRLLLSNTLQIVSDPIISIFINAFIWRSTASLVSIFVYVSGSYIFLPLAFIVNGFLLRKVDIAHAFWIGALCRGISVVMVVFFGAHDILNLFIFGCIWGFGNGTYWANRNYLELQETKDEERQYFYALINTIGTFSSVVVPFIAGWFIVFGQYFGWYSLLQAYWLLFGIVFLFSVGTAAIIAHGSFKSPTISTITRFGLNVYSRKRRLLIASRGFTDAIIFFPTLLVLWFFGTEGILGTVTAIVSLCVAITLYLYGRLGKRQYEYRALSLINYLFIIAALLLAFFHSSFTVILYIILSSICLGFYSLISEPVSLSLTDEEMAGNEDLRYSLIFDNELVLNFGRLAGTVLIFGLIFIFGSQSYGLLYGPLVAGIAQLGLLLGIHSMRRRPLPLD